MATQNWVTPAGTDQLGLAFLTYLLDRTDALRACFSGTTEPTAKTPYQFWADTTAGMLKQRNAANSAWVSLFPLAQPPRGVHVMRTSGALAAEELQIAIPVDATIARVVIVPDTTTSGSVAATTEWGFMLRNVTQAVDLFSATPTTGTSVGGVGGGEMTADTAYVLSTDQNQSADLHDVVRLTITQTGSPTAVVDVSVFVVYDGRGA